ncbi:hypothetical protein I3842_03G058200 [Carya illinoinensis]|uniref:non-specific serine/threonine protein kinase n=1 Tax=Carya illinoinensis TaxID=32201 RepID=A0A922FHQ6_CARIL|nr:hypothetical protein I3842_03G058200 [Carya illinoinensis]
MESWLSKQSAFLLLFFIKFLVFVELPVSLYANDWYSSCGINRFNCGKIANVGYPFWGDARPDSCGHPDLKLNCAKDITTIEIKGLTYRVLAVNESTKILKIVRDDYWGGICSPRLENTSLNPDLFDYGPGYSNITLVYGCLIPVLSTCAISGFTNTGVIVQIGAQGPGICTASVVFPVAIPNLNYNALENLALIEAAIKGGFDVKWKEETAACSACTESKGVCGYDVMSKNRTICYCPDQRYGLTCSSSPAGSPQVPSTETEPSRKLNRRLVVVIGIPTGTVVGIVVLSLVIICNVKRGHLSSKSTAWWKRYANNYHFNAHEKIIANFGSMAPKRYTYSDLKKLTKSFKDKVGEGGFGVVYKGKLPDGRIVAVKVLSKSKDNGEEFINEVASISRTSHVNIVSLLGFCCERSRRALIYEFVTNGSLDGFIYDKGTLDIANCHLENKTMFQIAIGIARGLEYLHSGCRTRILHLDIKPHNILLDKNFCPKISDFGLAKMCKTRDQSVVSMMGTRGTIGYIAPEVFSRTFGGVSHKSDVYSYGMLVLEMVGGRKDIEGGISGTSEKYFPHGIYKKLEQDEILGNSEVTRDEEDIVKKMIIVSLWCIQTNPLDRPSIGKVIEMLEGSTPQSLQFPPKPFLNSPPRPPIDSSTTSLSM